ncbi:hypothetical protein [Planctomonas sp. JC2975]|uniref:hypothetical protein n=1 Tax=Planctomonas sp. JC2975 TaxID=2729626 RepID=UPI00197C6D42|nr:hypothetical protein [Planctomonas sp. JC2975]
MKDRGFFSHKLAPGGYKIPVVNDCLVYVWRVPDPQNAVKNFASSPTRMNGFSVEPPHPTLFDPLFGTEHPAVEAPDELDELEFTVRSVGDKMPLVLVMVSSTPRQLQSVAWAIATLDDEGKVQLRGQESIWERELVEDDALDVGESFASGAPTEPIVELRQQEQF